MTSEEMNIWHAAFAEACKRVSSRGVTNPVLAALRQAETITVLCERAASMQGHLVDTLKLFDMDPTRERAIRKLLSWGWENE